MWIAVCTVVIPQDSECEDKVLQKVSTDFATLLSDTCDSSWQSSRDGLIISAHVFSDLAFLVLITAVMLLCSTTFCEY